jgi:hypothetical protein
MNEFVVAELTDEEVDHDKLAAAYRAREHLSSRHSDHLPNSSHARQNLEIGLRALTRSITVIR